MSETNSRASTATIKFGADGRDTAPWFVAAGSPADQREQIIEFFGFERASAASLSTAELLVQATLNAQAVWSAARSLGGSPLQNVKVAAKAESEPAKAEEAPAAAPSKPRASRAKPKVAEPAKEPEKAPEPGEETTPQGDVWDEVEGAADGPPWEEDPLIKQINEAETAVEFARIWKANQAEFTRDDVKAAAKAAQARFKAQA